MTAIKSIADQGDRMTGIQPSNVNIKNIKSRATDDLNIKDIQLQKRLKNIGEERCQRQISRITK